MQYQVQLYTAPSIWRMHCYLQGRHEMPQIKHVITILLEQGHPFLLSD